MRFKLIACKALTRELSYFCAMSDHVVDITWIRQGCHNTPELLQKTLQQEIDAIEAGTDLHTNKVSDSGEGDGIAEDFDAILLGYGLCSNAVTGLRCKSHRLVIPRAHDCVTLFLGSKEAYAEWFKRLPGCYWFTAGWIDNADMPGRERTELMTRFYRDQGYDEETVEYLLEELGGLRNYHNIAYIPLGFFDREKYHRTARDAADFYGWDYHEIPGNTRLLEQMVSGSWDERNFLVLEPGQTAVQSYDESIICARDGGRRNDSH